MALLRQTLLYLPAQVIAPAMQFASVLLWAVLLSPAQLGLVTMLTAAQEICYAAFFAWWGLYTLRHINSYGEEEPRRRFVATETAAIIASLAIEVAVLIPVLPLCNGGEPLAPTTLALAIAFISTRSLNVLSADRARAERRITLYSLNQIIGPVFGFGIGYCFMLLNEPSTEAVLAGFIIAQGCGVLLSVIMSDLFHRIGTVSRDILKTAAGFGGT